MHSRQVIATYILENLSLSISFMQLWKIVQQQYSLNDLSQGVQFYSNFRAVVKVLVWSTRSIWFLILVCHTFSFPLNVTGLISFLLYLTEHQRSGVANQASECLQKLVCKQLLSLPWCFKLFHKNLFFIYRGINMRYLGKVASILSLRADLEHVHVSVLCLCACYVHNVYESLQLHKIRNY